MSTLANYWAAKEWQVSLFTLDNGDPPPFYLLNSAINYQALNLSRPYRNHFSAVLDLYNRLRALRFSIQSTAPHVVLSFLDLTNVTTLLATLGLDVPVIVSERNDPHHHALKNPWRLMRPWLYRQASCVVAQSPNALDYFSPAIRERGKILHNPVLIPHCEDISQANGENQHGPKTILGMGRLHPQKGFDCLISVFASLASAHQDWNLEIWGEGSERGNLQQLIENLGLSKRVRLRGLTNNPAEVMRRAHLFVLSSRHEGFPNVLCEAMACGLPVVSFDCPTGPSDIIRHGIDGMLVPAGNTGALARTLDHLMASNSDRVKLGARAIEILDRFGLDKVMNQWSDLAIEVAGRKLRK